MKSFRERLVFDAERGEYRDGTTRYMMIRADTLMGIVAELPEQQRSDVLTALARAVERFGGRSAQTYRDAGAGDPAALIATIARTAPELGWGRWQLAMEDGGLVLTVANSPFVAGHGPSRSPVCHAIVGMLAAVGRLVCGAAVQAAETSCAAVSGGEACRFRALPVTTLEGECRPGRRARNVER